MLRVASLFVVVVLLALLFQLPRADDAHPPLLVGGEILRIDDLVGAAVYVDLGPRGVALVRLSSLEMNRDSAGNAYVTRLEGTFLEAGSGYAGIRIDATERAGELGWRPVVGLDGLSFPGAGGMQGAYEFTRVRFQKVLHDDLMLAAVSAIEGVDRMTGRAISEKYEPGRAVCPSLPVIACSGAACTAGGCLVLERDGWIVGCRCSGGGECFWTLAGTACWQSGCDGTCRAATGWSAGCRCG